MAAKKRYSNISSAAQSVADTLAVPAVVLDREGTISAGNEAWRDLCDDSAREDTDGYLGSSYFEVCGPLLGLGPTERATCHRGVRAVLDGALPGFRFDCRGDGPGGQRNFTLTVAPLAGEAGGALLTHVDVTEQGSSAATLERLLEAPIDAMMVVNEGGTVTMVNAQMEQMFGYTREELLGKHVDALVPERFRARHERHHAHYFADPHARPMGTGLELLARRKDGSEFPVEISLTPLETHGQMLISAAIRDVSDVRLAEAQVARLGRLLESSLNEIYLFDADSLRFSLVNRGARDNLGYSAGELALLTPLDLKPEFTKQGFEDIIRPLRTGEKDALQFTTVHRRKDGTRYPVEVQLQLFGDEKPPLFAAVILDTTERDEAERALRESESRVALHVEHTPLAVIEWVAETREVTAWNRAAERIFGYHAGEVLGRDIAELIVPRGVQDQFEQIRQGQFGAGGLRSTHRNRTKDGRSIVCEWYLTLLEDERNEGVRVAALALDVTDRQRALEALLTAQEEERGRISRDVHDGVGQSLTAILLGINTLKEHPDERGLERLRELTAQTLDDVRRIARDLRPALLDELGLEAALRRFARDLAARSGVAIDVLVRLPQRLERNTEIVIYRVVQEALTNVVRHAHAENASVIVTAGEEHVHLLVEDDGRGFEVASLSTNEHVGLAGMRERLELLGGTLRLESAPGRGTTISARLQLGG